MVILSTKSVEKRKILQRFRFILTKCEWCDKWSGTRDVELIVSASVLILILILCSCHGPSYPITLTFKVVINFSSLIGRFNKKVDIQICISFLSLTSATFGLRMSLVVDTPFCPLY